MPMTELLDIKWCARPTKHLALRRPQSSPFTALIKLIQSNLPDACADWNFNQRQNLAFDALQSFEPTVTIPKYTHSVLEVIQNSCQRIFYTERDSSQRGIKVNKIEKNVLFIYEIYFSLFKSRRNICKLYFYIPMFFF